MTIPKIKGANITKRGASYRVYVSNGYDSDGKKIAETATWKPDPQKTDKQNSITLQDFTVDFMRKVKGDLFLDGEKMTYSDFIRNYYLPHATENLSPTTYENAVDKLQRQVLPQIGHLRLAELKPLHIKNIYKTLQDDGYIDKAGKRRKYAARSIKRLHEDISATLTFAVDMELIEKNPALKAKPPKVESNPADIKCFTADEARNFLQFLENSYSIAYRGRQKKDGTASAEHIVTQTIPTQIKVFFTLAIYGGFRRGELIALNWSDINFTEGAVSVTKSTARTKAGQITKEPKTKSSNRSISVPPAVMAMLKKYKAEQQQQRLALGSAWQGENWLFIQADGKQMCITTPGHIFDKTLKRYNKDTSRSPLPVIPLHGLRHTAATLLIANHVDVRTVSGRLGHANTRTTLDVYSHFLKEADEKAATVMADLLEARSA
jgi:integrase